ncbi:putative phosphodiesterase [Alkalicoccobacillus murimartini]|uniref:Phosphodiesterase n=2 Tax=Alkalicoccobacillus murimartini TaxID=171685 RepID=A0ABT9YCZ8_9BACI|nr:putative phosphodiesterase [Alkalicoccobacillus murimartini]
MKEMSPDAIFFLGDAVMKGPQPGECLELLQGLQLDVAVKGNYDHMFTRFPKPGWTPANAKQDMVLQAFHYDLSYLSEAQQNWLGTLPEKENLLVDQTNIECFHAAWNSLVQVTYPWSAPEEMHLLHEFDQTDLILFGHVHHAFIRQANRRKVVNTGSVGLSFDGDPRASYAIIDIDDQNIAVQLRRVSYDREKVIEIARNRNMPYLEAFESGIRLATYPSFENTR